jgi:hypothetical protein
MTGWIIAAILLPVVLAEFGEVSPWLARRIVTAATRLLPSPRMRARYAEEWAADLERVPGKVTKLAYAITLIAATAPALGRRALQAERQAPGMRAAYQRAVALLNPRDLSSASLQPVVDILASALGFAHSALNMADGRGNYTCAALCGPEDLRRVLTDKSMPKQNVEMLLAHADPWGNLRFLRQFPPDIAVIVHFAEAPARPGDPGAWRPEYGLFVPLEVDGEMIGFLSLDEPTSGRIPCGVQRELLEDYGAVLTTKLGALWHASRSAVGGR